MGKLYTSKKAKIDSSSLTANKLKNPFFGYQGNPGEESEKIDDSGEESEKNDDAREEREKLFKDR